MTGSGLVLVGGASSITGDGNRKALSVVAAGSGVRAGIGNQN